MLIVFGSHSLSAYGQMSVLIAVLALGDSVLGLSMNDPSQQTELFTIVFNTLVQMSLFNQVSLAMHTRMRSHTNTACNIYHLSIRAYVVCFFCSQSTHTSHHITNK